VQRNTLYGIKKREKIFSRAGTVNRENIIRVESQRSFPRPLCHGRIRLTYAQSAFTILCNAFSLALSPQLVPFGRLDARSSARFFLFLASPGPLKANLFLSVEIGIFRRAFSPLDLRMPRACLYSMQMGSLSLSLARSLARSARRH
jgi:hypothetical protein